MSNAWIRASAVVMALSGFAATASAADWAALRSTHAAIGARTSVPYGWVDFCNRYASDCDGPVLSPVDIELTSAVAKDIERIDRQVNASVEPVTDMEHWGVVDRWDYPMDGKGDCEDYALLKKKILIARGYPRQSLLITVVKDHDGEGHAILTIKTNRGDYILDNLNDKVLPWTDTGYKFIKRQSQEDPNVWESIGAPASGPQYTAR